MTIAPDLALASTLRRLRLERGLTQEALAFHANVTVSALARIERGLSNPAWTTLVRIANALDITPAELVATAEGDRKQTPGKQTPGKQTPEQN